MGAKEVKKNLEERRSSLIHTLENGNLELSKQHQVYGAIKELENVLRVLEETNEASLPVVELDKEEDPGFLSKIAARLKK